MHFATGFEQEDPMPGLQIVPTLTCSLCDQLIDFERQQLDTSEVVLFGTAPYAWCLSCGQEVPRPWTEEYKDRWKQASRELRGIPAGAIWSLRAAFRSGLAASREGRGLAECELSVGPERTAWVEGYLQASLCERSADVDHAFRRWVCAHEHERLASRARGQAH